MADEQKQAPPDANAGWEDLKSKSGAAYRIKASDYDIKEAAQEGDSPAASGPAFNDVAVFWTVGSEGSPSQDVQNRTAITWYKLETAEWWSVYKYKLTINAKDTYNYKFSDEEPDSYGLNVFGNSGTHSLEYRSNKPNIVKISGS